MPKAWPRAGRFRRAPLYRRSKCLSRCVASAADDDGQLLVRDERAVVGPAAQHVGAGLAEAHPHRQLAVRRNRGRRPLRRPWRVRAGARVLPRLTCGGSNVTVAPAGSRYTNHDTCRPRFLPTVMRVGGDIAGLRSCCASAGSAAARSCDLLQRRARRRRPPLRNAVVLDVADDGRAARPTFTVRLLTSSMCTVGGLLARTSGLLVPAPSAPVSDAFTTSSTM